MNFFEWIGWFYTCIFSLKSDISLLLVTGFLLAKIISSDIYDDFVNVFNLWASSDFVMDKISTSGGFGDFVLVFISCEVDISLLLLGYFLFLLSSSGKFVYSIIVFTS